MPVRNGVSTTGRWVAQHERRHDGEQRSGTVKVALETGHGQHQQRPVPQVERVGPVADRAERAHGQHPPSSTAVVCAAPATISAAAPSTGSAAGSRGRRRPRRTSPARPRSRDAAAAQRLRQPAPAQARPVWRSTAIAAPVRELPRPRQAREVRRTGDRRSPTTDHDEAGSTDQRWRRADPRVGTARPPPRRRATSTIRAGPAAARPGRTAPPPRATSSAAGARAAAPGRSSRCPTAAEVDVRGEQRGPHRVAWRRRSRRGQLRQSTDGDHGGDASTRVAAGRIRRARRA